MMQPGQINNTHYDHAHIHASVAWEGLGSGTTLQGLSCGTSGTHAATALHFLLCAFNSAMVT